MLARLASRQPESPDTIFFLAHRAGCARNNPMPAGSAPRHASAVRASLEALQRGVAQTKQQAARLAGIAPLALTPAQLGPLVARSPDFRHDRQKGRMLDMVTDVDGETVSMRQALSGCAEAALRSLRRHGRRADEVLTREEREALSRAKMLLGLCRESGLWDESGGDNLPAELQAQRMRDMEADAMSVDSWMRDYSRTDGIGPTARKMLALSVQDVEPDTDSPTGDASE